MDNLHLTANIGFTHGKYHVALSLVEFKEENVTIVYSPALDLSGSGYSEDEAKQSFNEALNEFFRYTNNKNTLDKVLKDLGWAIKGSKKKPKFNPPSNSELVSSNPLFSEIINNKDYKTSKKEVEFAY